MQDPYRTVAVNIASSLVLLIGILFYRFIFPKKRINLFCLLMLISILPVLSIFRTGTYESGDFNIHIYRIMSFFDSLREGNLIPSWAGQLNANYGYPLFIFNYTLPYYIVSFFHFIGLSFIASLKIFLASTYVLSGIFMYLFAKRLFKNKFAAFTASIFYLFTPYHVIDLSFKIGVGELLTFTFIPLIFLSLHELFIKQRTYYFAFGILSSSWLIMSNALIAFFVGGLILAYVLFLTLNKAVNIKYLLLSASLVTLALISSLFVLIPPFLFNDVLGIKNTPLIIGYSPTLIDLLYSPWRGGFLFQGHYGEISNLIGYTQIFIILIVFYLIISRKVSEEYRGNVLFWFIAIIFIIFLIIPSSRFLWEYFSFAKAAGAHRLLLLLTFCISILSGYMVIIFEKNKLFIWIIILITIGSTILNWGHRRVIPEINDSVLRSNLWKSTSEGEGHYYANTKWADVKNPWFSNLPKDRIEIITGVGKAKDVIRTSTVHTYLMRAQSPLQIQENTLYFPGWKGFIDGKEIALYPSDKGIIRASIPSGNRLLVIKYEDILAYKIIKIISVITQFSVLFALAYSLMRRGR